MITCCVLLSLLSVLSHGALSDPAPSTFTVLDPVSGAELTCSQCPPGQFLRSRCTASSPSVCEDCPPGSFTALWNYIGRCLRCGICARNMVQRQECRRDADCSCECRRGYWFKERAGMCVRWNECGTGHGVTAAGSPQRDIVCSPCTNGTFSDRVSSESGCSAHSVCVTPRSEVLKATAWHDVICASPQEARNHDAAHFLRPLLPSFFSHHALSVRRLRHLLGKLPVSSSDSAGKRRRSVSGLTQDQLRARLDQWVREAGPAHLRSLPLLLAETGAMYTAERLTHKLGRIEENLRRISTPSQEVVTTPSQEEEVTTPSADAKLPPLPETTAAQ